MKKKIHKLSLDLDFDFDLIGISSSENDYKLSWKLNNELKLKLTKAKHLIIGSVKSNDAGQPSLYSNEQSDQQFSLYTFEDHEHFDCFNLISNRGNHGYLIEELKNIDYFLQIHGLIDSSVKDQMIAKLKSIEGINSIFIIDPNTLGSKEKLLF